MRFHCPRSLIFTIGHINTCSLCVCGIYVRAVFFWEMGKTEYNPSISKLIHVSLFLLLFFFVYLHFSQDFIALRNCFYFVCVCVCLCMAHNIIIWLAFQFLCRHFHCWSTHAHTHSHTNKRCEVRSANS